MRSSCSWIYKRFGSFNAAYSQSRQHCILVAHQTIFMPNPKRPPAITMSLATAISAKKPQRHLEPLRRWAIHHSKEQNLAGRWSNLLLLPSVQKLNCQRHKAQMRTHYHRQSIIILPLSFHNTKINHHCLCMMVDPMTNAGEHINNYWWSMLWWFKKNNEEKWEMWKRITAGVCYCELCDWQRSRRGKELLDVTS